MAVPECKHCGTKALPNDAKCRVCFSTLSWPLSSKQLTTIVRDGIADALDEDYDDRQTILKLSNLANVVVDDLRNKVFLSSYDRDVFCNLLVGLFVPSSDVDIKSTTRALSASAIDSLYSNLSGDTHGLGLVLNLEWLYRNNKLTEDWTYDRYDDNCIDFSCKLQDPVKFHKQIIHAETP